MFLRGDVVVSSSVSFCYVQGAVRAVTVNGYRVFIDGPFVGF